MNQRGGAFRFLSGMEKTERIGAVGIHAGVEIHFADSFELPNEEGILT